MRNNKTVLKSMNDRIRITNILHLQVLVDALNEHRQKKKLNISAFI